jgi:hypothetical protein
MNHTMYLGFDPGRHTGIAWMTHENPGVLHHAVCTPMQSCDLIYQILNAWHHDEPLPYRIVVSGESYVMGSSVRSHQPDALHILGAVGWMVHKFFPQVIYMETGASSAAYTGTRQTLTAAGWWTAADEDQHRNRAAAQIAHAMMMTEPRRWYDLINR